MQIKDLELKDVFAMFASIMLAERRMDGSYKDAEEVAEWSYMIADKMMKEREKCVQ